MAKITKEIVFGNHKLILETGEVARQADGAVMASMNGTQVLVTVVWKKDGGESNDFFPLTVNYQEKFYAIGKIPGGFNKREGRPSDNETLISRLIDRPIRPLFPDNFFNEVQIIATVLSLNPEVSPDIIAMIGASAALSISGVPFNGPIGAARVGYKDGVYLLNPSRKEQEESKLDLVISGTKDAILMVESEAQELSEDIMRGAMLYGHEMMKNVIKSIEELAREVGKSKPEWKAPEIDTVLKARINDVARNEVEAAYLIKDKQQRYQRLDELREQTISALLAENDELNADVIANMFGELERSIVRNRILDGEPRIDGRDHRTVRPISIRTKFLERTHGSCLFTRGETQAIVVATLGNERDAQILDGISGESRDRFMLHYNFPPYSVGETGQVGSPKRREIGHGRLAKRALMAVLPDTNEFPYVLRIVSEITESNGSSSMATVCGTSLALMDAGVPLKAPVAGVAMGLIKEGDRYAVLTDILGDEDHLGDMDFKVAGTETGITALQMDIKISGITNEIMERALEQALEGRTHILGVMNNALAEHRTELSQHAPRITTMKVAEDKIRTIIGKGGATIKGLIESTGVSIDIDDSGVIQLFSPDKMALEEAQKQIKALIAEIEVGQTYQGKVSKIVDFGAFINLLPGKDGLLHISQICADRTQKVEEVLQEGQEIEVFVAGIDKQGRVKLEWKDKPQAEAKEVEDAPVSATFLTMEEQSEEINSGNKISEEEE
ncbi:polyribonucleotide nucleotidyltransferase [Legionella pneumophila]|uniref:polyribonucleotide nucleotidyltransferase n=1 Tax=Legionella pneumophila TaxID=446 RepID=UPI001374C167|nr:polyribonucleotide nucleotidyltransferase [Legionella pneumophila]HAT8815077.1 polyribonucleotide nucleotidyltransferase [Legionella pneumophila subsp. pneumophila]MCZ4805962.1 polyribonucleotide nucleotidyltransferase [Legionella pneumophila]MDW9179260.1 polyribonucleotide nucleotidyltransferase [Legionella pneumophila]HAT1823517.1 polyribonucleotide nucleotidyltransferase [Legionella pneumophila]HAT1863698.1 polyribonucleotide nucleotidyltransferase [Legionella pneumophila]